MIQHCIIDERAEEFEMAVAGFMHARQDFVDNAQPGFTSDASTCNSVSGAYNAICACCGLEGADHGRPDRDDLTAGRFRLADSTHGRLRDAIRLIERQPPVKRRIAS